MGSFAQIERTALLMDSVFTWLAVALKATIPKCCRVNPLVTPAVDSTPRWEALSPEVPLNFTITVPMLAESEEPANLAARVGPTVAADAVIPPSRQPTTTTVQKARGLVRDNIASLAFLI